MQPPPSEDLVSLIPYLVRRCRTGADVTDLAERVRELAHTTSGSWTSSQSADTWFLTGEAEPAGATDAAPSGPARLLAQICDGLIHGRVTGDDAADALEGWLADALPDAERYELGPLLGKGGMGEVRAAEDRRLGRAVALKVLSRPGTRRTGRFLGEARLTAELEHPNIVPVHDLGTTADGRPYFAMKQVRGRSLAEVLETGDLGGTAERLDIVRKVCDAIAFAHDHGVVHRDLKPANIMIGAFGEVVVMDWGLAARVDETRSHGVAGTPAYMAPEQASGAEDQDHRVDVYALGTLLYELLLEQPAFDDAEREMLLDKVRAGAFPRPRQVDPSLPRELEELILACMARRPEDRLPDVVALKAELSRFLDGDDLACVTYTPAERLQRFLDRRWRAVATFRWVAGGLLVMLAVSSIVYLVDLLEQRRRTLEELAAAQIAIGDAELERRRYTQARAAYRGAESTLLEAGAETGASDLALAEVWSLAEEPLTVPLLDDRLTGLVLSAEGDRMLACDGAQGAVATVLGDDVRRVPLAGGKCAVAFVDGRPLVAHHVEPERIAVHDVDSGEVWLEVAVSPGSRFRLDPHREELSVSTAEQTRLVPLDGSRPTVLVHREELEDPEAVTELRPSPSGDWRMATFQGQHDIVAATIISPDGARSVLDGEQVIFPAIGAPVVAGQNHMTRPGPGSRPAWEISHPPAHNTGWSSDDRWIWTLLFEGSLWLLSPDDGSVLAIVPGPEGRTTAAAAHAATGRVVLGHPDGTVTVHLRAGRPRESSIPFPAAVQTDPRAYAVDLSSDGRLGLAARDREIVLFDVVARRALRSWRMPSSARALALARDDRHAAVGLRDGTWTVLDLVDPHLPDPKPTPLVKILAVDWIDDSSLVVAGEPPPEQKSGPTVARVHVPSGRVVAQARPLDGIPWDLDVSGDGTRVVVGRYGRGDGADVAVLDTADLGLLHALSHPGFRTYGVALDHSGEVVAAGNSDGHLCTWWLPAPEPSCARADDGPTMSIAAHPARPWFFTVGFGGMLQAWDVTRPGQSPHLLRRWSGRADGARTPGLAVGVADDAPVVVWVGAFPRARVQRTLPPEPADDLPTRLVQRHGWTEILTLLEADRDRDPAALATALLALGEDHRAWQVLRDHPLPSDHPDRLWSDVVLSAFAP